MNLSVNSLISLINSSCRFWPVAVFVCLFSFAATAQQADTLKTDTLVNNVVVPDSSITGNIDTAVTDSLLTGDTLRVDSVSVADKEAKLGIKISKDALTSVVTTHATDSAVLNLKGNVFYLYGDAKATYEDLEIVSGKLIFYQQENLLTAIPFLDTAGNISSTQTFKQGEETFTYDTLKYNFKSRRALVRNARTQYGEGFIISRQAKRNADETISFYKSIYTTCNLPHPHFGIRANKLKVIPGKIIAAGPANLEIEDVPTPLYLPFGMFPINPKQSSGFILPSYTMEAQRGLGLQRGGYYFAISDKLGLISQVDIFSRGSWAIFNTAQYANRYKYSGQVSVNYSYSKYGEPYETTTPPSKDFQVNWSHQMDAKAKPGTNFSASVSFGTRSYNGINAVNVDNRFNNYASSISYSKSWVGKPYSFTAAIRHNQNTQSGQVTVGLPELNFNLGQFSPFQRKVMSGNPRWYEKISASYSVMVVNEINFYDSLFSFRNLKFSDFDNGIRHNASVQANYNILRYFNWNISVPYTEYWNTKQMYFQYDENTNKVDTTLNTGFFTSRDFNMSSSLSTRIYGMKLFKRGKIAGIRHVMTPNVTATYTPGFAHKPYGYMYESITNPAYPPAYRSPYEYTPVGGPRNPNNSGSVSFSLQNTLQMKVRSKDSVNSTTKINLIDGLSINGSYDLFADSFNMSNVNMSFFTSVLNIFRVSANAVFDPYVYNGSRKTAQYLVNNDGGLAKFANGGMSIGIVLADAKKNVEEQKGAEENNDEVKRLLQNDRYKDYYDFNIPWDLNINAGISASRVRRAEKADTVIFRPNFTINGGFNLTERWKVNVTSGLAFNTIRDIEPGYTTIDIVRDLHCWQMSLNLVPFGTYRSFHFTLQVKSAMLQDLKLVRRRAYQDNL